MCLVEITFGRPGVKDREIWGKLVPYGGDGVTIFDGMPMLWGAGANENTIITLGHNAKINGNLFPAGTRIAFESNQDNISTNHSEIYVVNIDGTNLKCVTNTSSNATAINPDWYPSGSVNIDNVKTICRKILICSKLPHPV